MAMGTIGRWIAAGALVATALLPCDAWAASGAPVADMSGTVYLSNGQAAARLTLRALGSMNQFYPGHETTPPGGSLAGEFRIPFRTDAQGHYRVRLDPPRSGSRAHFTWPAGVSAAWNLYLVSSQGYSRIAVRVKQGQREVRQDIRLQPGERVTGRVLAAATGRPVGGATVYVTYSMGFPSVAEWSRLKTDAQGGFRVPDQLPPGVFDIGADAKDWALLATPGPKPIPPKLQEAEVRRLTFYMVPRSFTVRVLVLRADSTPLRNQRVDLWIEYPLVGPGALGGTSGLWHATDEHGRFTLTSSWQPDVDASRAWALAYPRETLRAEFRGQQSNSVTIDTLHPSRKDVVLRLR